MDESDLARDEPPPGTITRLLREAKAGRSDSYERLMERAYVELRRLAAGALAAIRPREGLDVGDVIHAAYARLAAREQIDAPDHERFFALWAKAMRSVLVDAVRRERAAKRRPAPLAAPATFRVDDEEVRMEVLELDEALLALEKEDAVAAAVTEQLFFAGRSFRQVATVLDLPLSTVSDNWKFARAWLVRRWQAERRSPM